MPALPRRSLLTPPTVPISSQARCSRRCRILVTDARKAMAKRLNKREQERILKAEHNEFHEPNGHKGLGGGGGRPRRGGHRCRTAPGGIAIASEFKEGG